MITCLRVALRELETFRITFDGSVGWTAHQTVFYLSCNSGSEILAALQAVETVVRTKDIVLTPMSLRCSRLIGLGMGFVAIWIPVGLSSGLSP